MGDPLRMEKINAWFILMLVSMSHNSSLLFVFSLQISSTVSKANYHWIYRDYFLFKDEISQ